MKKQLFASLAGLACLFLCVGSALGQDNSPAVFTDKSDYQPGETVVITGSGFQAGETVQLQVLHIDGTPNTGEGHEPWTVTANENGDFLSWWFVTWDDSAGSTFQLTATGLSSGLTAQTIFTDTVTVTPASGGTNISADKAQNGASPAWTTLGNIVITEGAKKDFKSGNPRTLILNAPAGWRFNTNATVTTWVTGDVSQDVSVTGVAVTATNITLTLNVDGENKWDTLTISNIQVQATDGANIPAAGNILSTGSTVVIVGVTHGTTSFGALSQAIGAASKLTIQTQPSSTATAGVAFSQQPVIRIEDQFGNLRANDNSTVVTAARSAGSGTLQGTTSRTAVNGVVTFTDLSHNVANTITIQFTATGLTSATSSNITVNPAAANKLAFTTQPANTTVGATMASFVVQIQDTYGNSVPQSGTAISLTLNGGSGLGGTTTVNTDSGGKATFNNVNISQAGTGRILTASGGGLTPATSSSFDVSKASTTTAVGSSQNPSVYGDSVTFTATVSPQYTGTPSGTVIFKSGSVTLGTATLSSGQAAFTTNRLSVAGSPHSITAEYAGDANFNGSTSSAILQAITAKGLTVSGITANNKVYDGNTTATLNTSGAALVGVVSGDDVTLNTGGAAGAFVDASAGTGKTVTVSGLTISGAESGNYTLTQPTTTANIAKADTTTAITSSLNPALPTENVTFTATVSPVAPCTVTPTGVVQFKNNGANLGSPVSLVNGQASLEILGSALGHGSMTITAEYMNDDGNFNNSTGTLSPNQIVNTGPTVGVSPVTYQRARNLAWRIRVSTLLTDANATDPDGDTLSISAVSSPTTNGARVTLNNGYLFYSPPATNGNVSDSFTYTVNDSFGASAQGMVIITVPAVSGAQGAISSVISNNTVQLKFNGIPGFSYVIQRSSPEPAGPWMTLATVQADQYGRFFYDDTNAPPDSAYYRAIVP